MWTTLIETRIQWKYYVHYSTINYNALIMRVHGLAGWMIENDSEIRT